MTTDQKGTIAETSIVAAAVKLGIGVLKPVNDGLRYDLVFSTSALGFGAFSASGPCAAAMWSK